jgi:hypothetical protein
MEDRDFEEVDMEMSFDERPHVMVVPELQKIEKFKQEKKYKKLVASYISTPQAKMIWKKIAIVIVIIAALLLILSIYAIVFMLLRAVITSFGALLILGICHFLLFRLFCHFSTFPGSYRLWLREVEYKFWVQASYKMARLIKDISRWIENFLKENVTKTEISEFIEKIQLFKNTPRVKNTDHINILKISDLLQKTRITINNHTWSLWEIDMNEISESDQSSNLMPYYSIKFEDHPFNHVAKNLSNLCKEVSVDLYQYYKEVNCVQRFWVLFKYKPFGRIDQMRNELEIRYNGVQTWCTSYDGKKIDCMLIPAVQNLNSTIIDYKRCPTMMLCNPNAGFYEYIAYQSEWLSYINIGVNVAIWNYRGYGRSQGSPSPQCIKKDGVWVIKHFIDHFGLTGKIGIHGESLGGSVAWYVARKFKVDFLFANRTFNHITHVPLRTFGPIPMYLYKGLTWFSDDVAGDFLEAKCYKVVGCDPLDETINDLCSLKVGIAKRIIEKVNNLNYKKFKFEEYFHIVSPEEGNDLRENIKYLLNLNGKMQVWRRHSEEQKYNKELEQEENTSNDGSSNPPIELLHQSSRFEEVKNFDDSMVKQVSEKFKKLNQNNTMVVNRPTYEEPGSRNPAAEYLETCHDLEGDDDNNFFKVTSCGTFDNTEFDREKDKIKYEKILKYLQKQEPYHERSDYKILAKVLLKIHRIIEKVEAVGIPLTNVFEVPKRDLKFAFKMFFINLDVWGNWDHKYHSKVKKLPYLMRKEACTKIELAKINLERCIALLRKEKGILSETVRFKTVAVHSWFKKISEYLANRIKLPNVKKEDIHKFKKVCNDQHDPKTHDQLENRDDLVPIELIEDDRFESVDLRHSKMNESNLYEENKFDEINKPLEALESKLHKGPFSDEQSQKFSHKYFKTYDDPSPDDKGHLFWIKWGHNGNFSIEEKSFYEKHLTAAGFMSLGLEYENEDE